MILNYLEEGWFHIFAVGKSNAAIFYSPIEWPKVTALRKWPLNIFSAPNEQSLFRSTYAEFRNSKSQRITKTGKAKFNSPLFLITTLNLAMNSCHCSLQRLSYDLEKWFQKLFCNLFYQPMDDKIKTWTLRFPATENPNTEKALVYWPIVLQYDVKAKYRLICTRVFGHEVFLAWAYS